MHSLQTCNDELMMLKNPCSFLSSPADCCTVSPLGLDLQSVTSRPPQSLTDTETPASKSVSMLLISLPFEFCYWKFMAGKLYGFYIALYGMHKPYISLSQITEHLNSSENHSSKNLAVGRNLCLYVCIRVGRAFPNKPASLKSVDIT